MDAETNSNHLTRVQATEEVERLRSSYSDVRLLSEATLCKDKCLFFDDGVCMRTICKQVIADGKERSSLLRIGENFHKATARYVDVDGEPNVLVYVTEHVSDEDLDINKAELYHDALTGAFNRRFYEDDLRNQRMYAGVAIIDLDDFKLVNDTLGHHAGDTAIKAAAEAMQRCLRPADMLVRYGGDEFVVVLPNADHTELGKRLRAIADSVSRATVPGYDQIHLSVSIGGLLSQGHIIEDAVKHADALMYRAKQRGNTVLTDEDKQAIEEGEFRKPLLLIVDDSSMNREILTEMLQDDYEILQAENGALAIDALEEHGKNIALVLLDIVMPELDGFGVLSRMVRRGWIEDIPVIMISSEDSDDSVLRAYELGASDYIGRPFDMRVVRQRVSNIMRLYTRQRHLSAMLAQQFYECEKSSNVLVNIMGGAMELRNGESGPHVLHVRNLTEILLERLLQKTDKYDISSVERATIIMTSTLHDIGKLAIPDNILNKPGRLTDEEFKVMKSHTTLGAQMLDKLNMYTDSPLLIQTAHDICLWHHERWDGKGYPDGLKGDEIPISAQVVSLADVYDALTSDRVYKKAYSHEVAMEMIQNGECGQFNPLLMECLVEMAPRITSELDIPTLTPPFKTDK